MAKKHFHHYAWGLLAYNVLVILGGAYVRASKAGDGCGAHWPTCQGQLLPPPGHLNTIIEFSHRISTTLLPLATLLLLIWSFKAFAAGSAVRKAAAWSVILTLAEGLIGAGLVLFRWVAHDKSAGRAFAMPAHLIVTFLLLGALALAAWWGGGGRPVKLRGQGAMGWILGAGIFSVILLGITGAIAALGDTLFPAANVATGLRQDFSPGAHFLLKLRVYHPLLAMSCGLFLTLVAGLAQHLRPTAEVRQWSQVTIFAFLVQMGVGVLNLAINAPIWMQLVHLLAADVLWIALVILAAAALGEGVPRASLSSLGPQRTKEEAAPGAVAAATVHQAATWKDYLALTKPRVISLLLFTTLTAMWIAEDRTHHVTFLLAVATGLGLYMAAGAANAINMVLERDLDLSMGRTSKRPTLTGAVGPREALQFALALTVLSFGLLWGVANLLCAMMAMSGLAFYVLIYTLLLKRRTWANIVIGGAAGAFPPLVGWAAVRNDLSPLAWCLFAIIFLWTPVHFWALALLIKEDYARAGVPMLPVVRGDKATVVQIAYYAVLTVAVSAAPLILGANGHSAVGWIYIGAAVLLNGVLLLQSARLYRHPEKPEARSLFKYSMVYLALLFLAMALDRALLA